MLIETPVNMGLQVLINFIASTYFTDCFATCNLFSHESVGGPAGVAPALPSILMSRRSSGGNSEQDANFAENLERAINAGCKCWIVEVPVVLDFLDKYENITSTTGVQRPIRPKFLIYGFHEESSAEPEWLSTLSHPLMKNVPDVLFIRPSSSPPPDAEDGLFDFDLLTTKFVGRLNNSTPVLIESVRINSLDRIDDAEAAITFEFARGENQKLYSRGKVFNLQDRHLALAVFPYRPYISVTQVPAGEGNANSRELYMAATKQETEPGAEFPQRTVHLDGYDGALMLEFCKKRKCSLLMVEDDGYEWGEVYDNYTGNGMLGRVVEKSAELAVGSLFMWYHEYLFVEFSVQISRSGITTLVPKPKILESPLIALMPFSLYVWLAVGISYIVAVLMNFVVEKTQERILFDIARRRRRLRPTQQQKSSTFVDSIFFVYGIFVEQSVVYRYFLSTKRVLLAIILLEGFVVGSVFAGSFLSFLAIPRHEAPIDTPEQLADSNVPWSATHLAWIYSILDTDNPVMMTVRDHFQVHSREELQRRNTEGTMGLAIEQLDYGYFAFGDYVSAKTMEKMRLMREDIFFGNLAAAIVRSWYLKDEFDEFVLRVAQSGLQSYWLLDCTFRQMDLTVQRALGRRHLVTRDAAEEHAQPLRLDQMVGIFYVLAFGLLLALAVFVAELLHYKYRDAGPV